MRLSFSHIATAAMLGAGIGTILLLPALTGAPGPPPVELGLPPAPARTVVEAAPLPARPSRPSRPPALRHPRNSLLQRPVGTARPEVRVASAPAATPGATAPRRPLPVDTARPAPTPPSPPVTPPVPTPPPPPAPPADAVAAPATATREQLAVPAPVLAKEHGHGHGHDRKDEPLLPAPVAALPAEDLPTEAEAPPLPASTDEQGEGHGQGKGHGQGHDKQ